MKNIWKKLGSLFLSAALVLSTAVTPAMAADKTPPTEVQGCTKSGLWVTELDLTFSEADDAWLDAVDGVSVNGTSYEKQTISSSSSATRVWNVGNVMGAYGSEKALQIVIDNADTFPLTAVVSADGYADLTISITKERVSYQDVYTATVVAGANSGGGENGGETGGDETLKEPPASFTCSSSFGYDFRLTFTQASDWLAAISGVQVNGSDWSKGSGSYSVWNNQSYYVDSSNGYVYIGENFSDNPATCVISAEGYLPLALRLDKTSHTAEAVSAPTETTYSVTVAEDIAHGEVTVSPVAASEGELVTVTAAPEDGYQLEKLTVDGEDVTERVEKNSYTFTMPGRNVLVSAVFEESDPAESGDIRISFTQDPFGSEWYVTFSEAGFAGKVTGVSVNGTPWTESIAVSSGGVYKKDTSNDRLVFAAKDFSPSSTTPILRSGDVVTITAQGYTPLTFKLVIDTDGNASAVEDDGKGDPYALHVKLEGSFEAAIVGQKDYDGVSSASVGGASSNKNSAVKVYGALVEKDAEVTDSDWEELDNFSKVDLNGSKCAVSIVPDTASGTPDTADSGMEGVYLTISSDLTLSGTPKDAGSYLISVSVEDMQGRTATSNALPFRIYTGEETLAERLVPENLQRYESGKYAWNIMEPWAIKNFGSNVAGEEESVRVPAELEAWFGSQESGTYGYLGYDIPWKQVEKGDIPQTLYIPSGCELTFVNMEILSSVRIVVENGGKLTLSDSVVQGIIDVENGGTFSMNYDGYAGEFTTGASLCGQLRLADGAILESAAIYSHANYLANGNLVDRTTHAPVVTATGNVTVRGQVFIEGDDAGDEQGQTALRVENGTLTLEDGATLVAYGGSGTVTLYSDGGSAIELDNGTITGQGKLVAIGGQPLWGDGGSAVTGSGTVSTTQAYLQGATASASHNKTPGKALDGSVTVSSLLRHVADGTQDVTGVDDPLAALYWKSGIELTPPLDRFTIDASGGYVLMNIPYDRFYEAEQSGSEMRTQVDAVTSATLNKTRSALAAGSYHKNADGSDISGVIYPVYVADLSVLQGCTQVTDADFVRITVTLRGQETTTEYQGKDALFENGDYAYYLLKEEPSSCKELTVAEDGTFSFGPATGTPEEVAGTVTLQTGGRHTYYEMTVSGLPEDVASRVAAVTLHTQDGAIYGLRHVAEIWRGTELGFGSDGAYAALQGKTIDCITYYLSDGPILRIGTETVVPQDPHAKLTVASAWNVSHAAAVTIESLPEDFQPICTVRQGESDLSAYSFRMEDGTLVWTGTPAAGTYTLLLTDGSGKYAPVSAAFTLEAAGTVARYDADSKALVKADAQVTDAQFADYLRAITAVVVDGSSYAAVGEGAVQVVRADGTIDLTAAPFTKGDGASYTLTVLADGYPALTFTVSTAKQDNGSTEPSQPSNGGSGGSSTSSVRQNPTAGDSVETPAAGSGFGDVSASDYFASAVQWAVDSGITSGVTSSEFAPYSACTRAQIITFLWRAAGSPLPQSTDTRLTDVQSGIYYYNAVLWAMENGIAQGVSETEFAPDATVTRSQTVAFLYRAAGSPAASGHSFSDVPTDAYYSAAVQWAVEQGITQGVSADRFAPANACTRAQIVTFLYRQMSGK